MRVIISLLAVVSRDLPLLKRVRSSQEQKASEAHRDSSRDGRQGILSCGLTTACAKPDKQNKGSRTATPSRSDRNAPGAHPGRHLVFPSPSVLPLTAPGLAPASVQGEVAATAPTAAHRCQCTPSHPTLSLTAPGLAPASLQGEVAATAPTAAHRCQCPRWRQRPETAEDRPIRPILPSPVEVKDTMTDVMQPDRRNEVSLLSLSSGHKLSGPNLRCSASATSNHPPLLVLSSHPGCPHGGKGSRDNRFRCAHKRRRPG